MRLFPYDPGNRGTNSTSPLVGRLRYRQLALLVALGEHGNLHRAAAAIHLAQPSATKLVRQMEQLFGFPLFERLPRGMCPTTYGADVVAFARRALLELHTFGDELQRKRQGDFGRLRVGTTEVAAAAYVVRALIEFTQQPPRLSVKLFHRSTDELTALLSTDQIDLAIAEIADPKQDALIDYENLGADAFNVVARPSHPATRLSELRLSSLEQFLWILPPTSSPMRLAIDREFAEAGLEIPTRVIESSSPCTIPQIVRQSDAVAVLSESIVREHLESRWLAELPLVLKKQPPGFGILTRRGVPLTAAATEFIDILRRLAGAAFQQKKTDLNPRRTHPDRCLPDRIAASSVA